MKVLRISQIIILLVVLIVLSGAGRLEISPGHAAEQDVSVYLPFVRGGNVLIAHQNVDYVGHIGGWMEAITIAGNYAYVGEGASLVILDLTDPLAPAPLGRSVLLPSVVVDVTVSGSIAYVATGSKQDYGFPGLWVFDVSDPAEPRLIGEYPMSGAVWSVAVAGNYVYIANGVYGLRVMDASDPAHLTPLAYADTANNAHGVAVLGSHAYVADDWNGGLRVIDSSDPSNPFQVGSCDTPGEAYNVAVVGNYAYVADGWYGGLRVIDVTDPANPIEVGSYDVFGGAEDVTVAGDYAYLADGEYGLRVINISDPAHPFEAGWHNTRGNAQDVALSGNYAYVADGLYGLWVVDVSDPANMTLAGAYRTPTDPHRVAAADAYAYLVEQNYGLRMSDVSDPAHPVEIGYQRIPGSALDIDIAGSYAYVADEFFGLWVIDISDPANPVIVGSYAITSTSGVAVAGDFAYVVSNDGVGRGDNLYVVDISDPMHPAQVGFNDGTYNISDMAASGSTLYLSSFSDGLRVLDVSDPAHPLEVGAFEALPHADGVAVAGDYAYVAVDKSLWVIDVSEGANPIEVGVYHAPGTFVDWASGVSVTVAGDIVYIANGSGVVAKQHDGLRVIDVSDPSSPHLVGFYDTPGDAYDVSVSEGYVFVADGHGGLLILRYTGVMDASSTTIFSDQPDPSIVNGPVTVRVEVDAGFGIPSEEVSVTVEGETVSCSAVLVGGIGSCPITLEATGTYTLTASYGGDNYFLPSMSAAIMHTVVLPTLHYLPWVGGK